MSVFKKTIAKFFMHNSTWVNSWQDRKKNRPLMEPVRLQDLENSARSQTWQKRMNQYKLQLKIQLALGTSIFENPWEKPDNH